jgi:ABC-type branched-subunit amino acid transport system permease subunit
LLGPIVGAFALVLLGDGTTEILTRMGVDIPGVRQIIHGVVLLVVTVYMPHGVWPPISRALGFEPRRL